MVEWVFAVPAEAVLAGNALHEAGTLPPGTYPVEGLGIVGATSTPPVSRGHGRTLLLLGWGCHGRRQVVQVEGEAELGGSWCVRLLLGLCLFRLPRLATVWVVEVGRLVLPPQEPVLGPRYECCSRMKSHCSRGFLASRGWRFEIGRFWFQYEGECWETGAVWSVRGREEGSGGKILANIVGEVGGTDEPLIETVTPDLWGGLRARECGLLQTEELQGEEEPHCPPARCRPGRWEVNAAVEPGGWHRNNFTSLHLLCLWRSCLAWHTNLIIPALVRSVSLSIFSLVSYRSLLWGCGESERGGLGGGICYIDLRFLFRRGSDRLV